MKKMKNKLMMMRRGSASTLTAAASLELESCLKPMERDGEDERFKT